jgi:hypothetical protein
MADRSCDLSLVPGQIPTSLKQISISTAGGNGYDGGYGGVPSAGESGRNLRVDLYYDPKRPSKIQVADGRHAATEVSSANNLLLDTHGGHGGNGGIGTV